MVQQALCQSIPLLQELLSCSCSSVPNAAAGPLVSAAHSCGDTLPGSMTFRSVLHESRPDAREIGDMVHLFSLMRSGRGVGALPHTVRQGSFVPTALDSAFGRESGWFVSLGG